MGGAVDDNAASSARGLSSLTQNGRKLHIARRSLRDRRPLARQDERRIAESKAVRRPPIYVDFPLIPISQLVSWVLSRLRTVSPHN